MGVYGTPIPKDKDAELLKRINGMFRYVSFSFVNEQLNGGENWRVYAPWTVHLSLTWTMPDKSMPE